jgi:hypothetical protein
MTHESRRVEIADGRTALSSYLDRQGLQIKQSLQLRPDEGVIVKLHYNNPSGNR